MKLRLHVATLGEGIALPASFPRLGKRAIDEYFREASRKAAGAPAIELELREPVSLDPALIATGAHSDALNVALAALTKNKWQDTPVTDIGLLFTTRASEKDPVLEPGSFGVMFDLGVFGTYARAPREGCAVFMETIAAQRGDGEVDEEALFTAIHELGHVFNLWHLDGDDDGMTFMRSSARFAHPLGADAWRFADGAAPRRHHSRFLQQCDELDEVKPGGTPYGKRGPYGPVDEDAQSAPASRARLALHIHSEPRTFWWFEPIELEIELACAAGRVRASVLPHELDPGYDRFEIWIDEPDGARRRYRPARRYCAASAELRIAPGQPFRRDLSIFGQAGGFTFRKPGPHTIQAFLRLPAGDVLRSNRFEVELRPPEASRAFERARAFFTDERVARLMFYRTVRRFGPWVDGVEDFARSHARSHWAPSVRYALGRARLVDARRFAARSARALRERRGRDDLARALDHSAITPNRARVARRLVSPAG